MRSWLAVSLLACLALAGCSEGGQGQGPAPGGEECDLEPALCDPEDYLAGHHCLKNDVRPRVYAPDTPGPDAEPDPWRQGDFWTYRLSVDGRTQTTTLVYYDDIDVLNGQAQHYLVGTAKREEAVQHALFSVNPMLGRIHRSLYSPHESGDHADMFHFPLCDGSTWTTRFYGTSFDMEARRKPTPLPDGTSDPLGFEIKGMASDGSTLRILYSPERKWFTELEAVIRGGPEVSMVLTSSGSGKTGRFEFLRAQQDEAFDLARASSNGFAVERSDGREGPYDLVLAHLDPKRSAGTGRVEVHLRDPAGTSVGCVGIAGQGALGTTQCPAGPRTIEAPYQPGTWRITVEVPPLDTTTKASGEARVVSAYDRGGTV